MSAAGGTTGVLARLAASPRSAAHVVGENGLMEIGPNVRAAVLHVGMEVWFGEKVTYCRMHFWCSQRQLSTVRKVNPLTHWSRIFEQTP